VDCVRVLIDLGAKVNTKNKISGATPLHCAVQSTKAASKRLQVIDLLLEKGKADVSLRDKSGAIPLYYCREGDDELIRSLRPAPAPRIYVAPKVKKVKPVDTSVQPDPLLLSCLKARKAKRAKQVDTSVRPEWDRLLSACLKNNPNLVRQLVVDEGISPSHSNGVGQSALHIAALYGHGKASLPHSLCFSFGKGFKNGHQHSFDRQNSFTRNHTHDLLSSFFFLQWNV
jgi:ankyrin repeat protein